MQSGKKRIVASLAMFAIMASPIIPSKAAAPEGNVEVFIDRGNGEIVRLFDERTEIEEENNLYQQMIQEEIDSAVEADQFYSWVSSQKGTVSVYRKNANGKLLVKIQGNGGNTKVFIVKSNSTSGTNEWEECIGDISVSDILNVAYTAYWEVGGKNSTNVWAQVGVIVNRAQDADFSKGNGILGVLSAPKQYSSWHMAKARKLKANTSWEKEDLNNVFQYVLEYMAGEGLYIPSNVVYAATFPQGSGTWKVINGTYYCYK